jgi:AraC family transcriptional regulator
VEPRIETVQEKKFAGKHLSMSFAENKTSELWKSFMPWRKEIKNNIGQELYSIEIYVPHFFDNFNPQREFEKWAAIEVTDFDSVPAEMETFNSPSGLYAIFHYKGEADKGAETYRYILATWLPRSDFIIDDRPHFAVMGEKYKNKDHDSEEELWIPIKKRLLR